MAAYVFGIDLGTTYSCISYIDETGRARVINNSEGTNTTPSVVNFASPTQVVVGQVAKENAVIDPQNTISLVKTLMGNSSFAINYNGTDKTPEEVSAYILRKLTEDASKMINQEVKDVVITCPAYFGTAEREATKNAGIIAGLNVMEIISEPTAAALFYGCTKEQSKKTILVYDLGGGTFDVTVMAIDSDVIEVICSDGLHQIGGKDWDEAIMRYLASEFCAQTGFDGNFDEYAQQDMRLKAEKAKQQLSSKEEVPIIFDASGLKGKIMISRVKFDELTDSLLQETLEKTDSAIEIAKSKGYDKIDEILLVGGSTRMPQVTKALIAKFGFEPKVLEPDEAVAKGASIYAATLHNEAISDGPKGSDDDPSPDFITLPGPKGATGGGNPIKIITSTTKSFAIQILLKGELKCENLIVKNEKMPDGVLSESRRYGTSEDNQTGVSLIVYENDSMDRHFNVDPELVLGEATLENLPPNLPKGSPIEVTFTLNKEGILKIKGRDLTGNKEVEAEMKIKGKLSETEVETIRKAGTSISVL